MALVVKDRVKESTTTTGTADFTLGGASSGFQTFAVIGNGNSTYYAIADQVNGDWEVGIGTYSTTGPTLTRDTILESSNSGSKVVFAAGTKEVFCTYPAERSVYLDTAGSAVTVLDIGTLGTSTANITTANITAGTVSTTPTSNNDIANKVYVDTIASSGITYHTPVKYEVPNTTGNLNATYNQPGGPGVGVGATLTNAGTLAAFAPDGPTASPGDRILVYNQTNQFENGVYTVTTVGNGSTAWVLTRATDADTYALKSPTGLGNGDAFFVTSGNTGAGETYVCNTPGPITFGTTAITFAQISDATLYTAGTGLTLTGTEFSITNTGTPGTYGSASNVPVFVTNAQGQVTSVTNTAISISTASVSGLAASATTDTTNAANISSGTLNSARLTGSYTGITGVGILTAGTWNGTVIGAAYGGTGQTSYTVGDILYANTTTSLAKLADVATGNALISGGVGTAPAWGKIGLGTHVSGTLQVGNGGTGATTLTGYVKGNGTSAFTASATIPNADTTATSANTASTIVARDASGDFSAGTITANLNGNASTATTASNVNNGALTLAVAGTGLSGSASFTANQSGNVTFTVTSNATSANTASTIVARDASGNFIANTITATLAGNASTATSATSAGVSTNLAGGVAGAVPYQSGAGTTGFSAAGSSGQYLQSNGTSAPSWVTPPTIGNGTLTMNTSGTGLSGSATFTANQTGPSTFTVASNATSANTASTIVARDASGNFSAGTITASLSGNSTTASSTPYPVFSGDAVSKADITTRTDSGFYETDSGTTAEGWPVNTGGWQHLIACTHSNDSNYFSMQVAGSFFDNDFYGRKTNGAGTTGWVNFLTSGNYNSYSPTLTGGGASGTWGINISGNAATATSATTAGASTYLITQDIRTLSPSSTAAYRLGFGFTSWANNNTAPYADYLALRSYSDASGGNDNLLVFNKSTIAMRLYQQAFGSASAYSSFADVLMSNNYNSYAPTLTGGGASGTWGINISGNAATATTASNANLLNSISAVNLYNNMGDPHSTRTSFDLTSPSYGFGYRFVQGNTNGPSTGGSQYYSWYIGLGSDYPATGAGSYGAMFAVDRNVTTPYLSVRYNEGNSFTGWRKVAAGYADSAGSATTADQIDSWPFRNTGSNAGTAADTLDSNGITYVSSNISLFGQSDGALYSQAYSSVWQHQIFGDYRTGQIAIRGENNGTWQAWRTVLDSSNYTSYAPSLTGSGASGTWGINISGNAATASNTSSISNAVGNSYTWTAANYFRSNGNTASITNPPLQAYSDNVSGAIMAFHRAGYYAVNMGLDSDNVFRIGGWSAAANRLQLDMSGNLTMAGNVTAYSDERLKTNWRDLPQDFIAQLAKVKVGVYDRTDEKNLTQVGVSAQSLQAVMPEAVTTGPDDMLSVSYGNAALAAAVKLAERVMLLEEKLAKLMEGGK